MIIFSEFATDRPDMINLRHYLHFLWETHPLESPARSYTQERARGGQVNGNLFFFHQVGWHSIKSFLFMLVSNGTIRIISLINYFFVRLYTRVSFCHTETVFMTLGRWNKYDTVITFICLFNILLRAQQAIFFSRSRRTKCTRHSNDAHMSIVLFHNCFFPSGEQSEQRILAFKQNNQLPVV